MSRGHKRRLYQSMGKHDHKSKSKRHDPDGKLRKMLMDAARTALLKAAEWCEHGEWGWALVMTEQAEALLKSAKALD